MKNYFGLSPWEPSSTPRPCSPSAAAQAAPEAQRERQRRREAQREQDFKERVESIGEALAAGRMSTHRYRASLSYTVNPMAKDAPLGAPLGALLDGARRATHLTLFPLPPMSIEEALRCGLLTDHGIAHHVYEKQVAALDGMVPGRWRRSNEYD